MMQFATFWAAFYNSLFAELLLMTLKPFINQDNTFACCCHQSCQPRSSLSLPATSFMVGNIETLYKVRSRAQHHLPCYLSLTGENAQGEDNISLKEEWTGKQSEQFIRIFPPSLRLKATFSRFLETKHPKFQKQAPQHRRFG